MAREEVRQHRRTIRIACAGAVALAALTAASIVFGVLALGARNDARRVAESRAVAGLAFAAFGSGEVDRGLLLSLQAYSISPTVQARSSLVQGLEEAGRVVRFLRVPGSVAVPATSPAFAPSITSVAFSPDGKTLAVGATSQAAVEHMYYWDVASGRRVGKPVRGGAPRPARGGVAIDVTGRLIATAASTRTLRRSVALFEARLSAASRPGLASGSGGLTGAALSPDGKVIAVVTRLGTVLRWDVATRHEVGPTLGGLVDPTAETTVIAFSPDGKLLAAGDTAGTVTLFDLAASPFARLSPATSLGQTIAPRCQTPGKVDAVGCGLCAEPCADAVSPDGRVSAVAQQGEEAGPNVFLLNVRTRRILAHLQVADPEAYTVAAIAFSPDGRTVAVSAVYGEKETVTLWDVATSVQLGRPLMGHRSSGPLSLGPDGNSLTLFTPDGTVTWRPLPLSSDIGPVRVRVCDLVGRNLTQAEWRQFLPGRSYQRTCPQWP